MRCQDRRLVASPLLAVFLLAGNLLACGSSEPKIVAGKMPEGGEFTGVYFSPQYGEMNMIQNGSAVVGEYKRDERFGKIQGEVNGDLMKFEWTEKKALVSNRAQETRGRGYFRYKIDPANGEHVIQGTWGLGDQESGGGPWNGVKSKRKQPKLSESSSSSGGEAEESDSSGKGSDDDENSEDLF